MWYKRMKEDYKLATYYSSKKFISYSFGNKKWNKVKHLTPKEFINNAKSIDGIGKITYVAGSRKLHDDGLCDCHCCKQCVWHGYIPSAAEIYQQQVDINAEQGLTEKYKLIDDITWLLYDKTHGF